MLENRKYTFGELMRVLQESSEMKPVMGKNVQKDNSQNNEKAVKDILKQTEKYNKVKETKRKANLENINDYNKTTLDVNFASEPSKAYKDRVKAQVNGFPSVDNEKNSKIKDNKSLDFEGNKEFYDNNKKKTKEIAKRKQNVKHAGLKSHNLPKEDFKGNNVFNESKKMKRLIYNKEFLSEDHVLRKIPDDYKIDGNRFMMKDIKGTEYIIECTKDKKVDYVYSKIVSIKNPLTINEEFDKIKHLYSYSPSNYNASSTCQGRQKENTMVMENINNIKRLMSNMDKIKN